jgi:hypothetical protein
MCYQATIQFDVFLQIAILDVDGALVLLHFPVFGLDLFHHMVDLRGQIRDIMDKLLQDRSAVLVCSHTES